MSKVKINPWISESAKAILDRFVEERPGVSQSDLVDEAIRRLDSKPHQGMTVNDLAVGTIWEVQALGDRHVLVEKKALQDENWRKQIAYRKDSREAELHPIKVAAAKAGLWERKERLTWQPRKCPYADACGIMVTWGTLAALEDHLREYHPDLAPKPRGVSMRTEFGSGQSPISWRGQFG